jgi:hypothetical protein
VNAIGPDHVVLSTDGGDLLLPEPPDAMRLLRSYMRAYGLSEPAIRQITSANPAALLGLTDE